MGIKNVGDEIMSQQIKVVIADESEEFGQRCKRIFAEFGMEVILCQKDGLSLLSKAKNVKPDIILADVFMSKLDILGVKSGLEIIENSKQPIIMAISTLDNGRLEKQLLDAGICYYFLMPFDLKTMALRILELSGLKNRVEIKNTKLPFNNSAKLEIDVTAVLHRVGIPPNIKGYYYLREAIILSITEPRIAEAVTGSLYPSVARKFSTTPSRVERAIRHAIEVACERGNINALNEYFSFALQGERGRPTNSEFVALVSDSLRLKMKSKYLYY